MFMCVWVRVAYRVARVVAEVDLGEAHVDDEQLHAHDATLVAVFVLGYDGHVRPVPDALEAQEGTTQKS